MNPLSEKQASNYGYSTDKRKRRRQHRTNARDLLRNGGRGNGRSAPGSTLWEVAQWHKAQARAL
jgi:hypothetical protein